MMDLVVVETAVATGNLYDVRVVISLCFLGLGVARYLMYRRRGRRS